MGPLCCQDAGFILIALGALELQNNEDMIATGRASLGLKPGHGFTAARTADRDPVWRRSFAEAERADQVFRHNDPHGNKTNVLIRFVFGDVARTERFFKSFLSRTIRTVRLSWPSVGLKRPNLSIIFRTALLFLRSAWAFGANAHVCMCNDILSVRDISCLIGNHGRFISVP